MAYKTLRALEKFLDVPVSAGALQLYSGVPLTATTVCVPTGFTATLLQMQLKVLQGDINKANTGTVTVKVYRNYTSDESTVVNEGLTLNIPYDCEANLSRFQDDPVTFSEDGNYSLVLDYVGTESIVVALEATFRLVSEITSDDAIDLSVLDGLRWTLPNTGYVNTAIAYCPLETSVTAAVRPGAFKYLVTARIRGVVEKIRFLGGFMLTPEVNVGGVNTNTGNAYSLQISSPPQTYNINAHDRPGGPYLIAPEATDFVFQFVVDSGALVTLYATSTDGAQLNNGLYLAEVPEIYEGIYLGQYAQMDVLNIEIIYDDVY